MTDKPQPPEEPRSVEDLRAHETFYQHRVEWRDEQSEGFMGSVLFPREGASEVAVQAYHEAMTQHGPLGVEYAQEALHGNGDYFDDFFDSVEECVEDINRMKEHV